MKFTNIDNNEFAKLFTDNGILLYHWDKLKRIISKYYQTGELKSINYLDEKLLIIYTKQGASISRKAPELEKSKFFEKNLSELLQESDREVEDEILNCFWSIHKVDFDYSLRLINKLIKSENLIMKVKAIEIAGTNYLEKCLDCIEMELNNKKKIHRYNGVVWDDFKPHDFDRLYATQTISELAKEAIRLIKAKHKKR